MLINFQVKNFGSFWRPTNFSMIASAVRRHPSHIAEINGRDVLRSAFIFGANAGGKSNFVKAIGFARKVIVDGLDDVNCDRRQFRLAADGQSDDIGVFQFTINADGKFYEYGMAIAYSKAAVVSEWLSLMDIPENPVSIFACDWSGDSPKIELGIKLEDADRTRFEVYCEDARNKTLRKRTFLSEIADKRSSCDSKSFFRILRPCSPGSESSRSYSRSRPTVAWCGMSLMKRHGFRSARFSIILTQASSNSTRRR